MRKFRILHLEDDATDAQLVQRAVQREEPAAEIILASSPRDFRSHLEAGGLDLILADHGLPGFSGNEALQLARQRCPNVPFIFVSGAEDENQIARNFTAGAAGYVLKHQLWQLAAALRLLRGQAGPEPRVRELTEQLAAANRELEAFAYSVSHDLRAPVRHIQGYTGLLTESLKDRLNETERRHVGNINSSTQRLGRLIDDLLAFSRLGRVELRHEPVNMDDLVKSAVNRLQPALASRNFVWKISPLPEVIGDAGLLRQLWTNLLDNAAKFTGPRYPAIIEIGATTNDGEVVFHVRDNGVGFDMQYATALFGVFKRMHTETQFEGTGIGLANSRRIVERHGGRTWAEAAVDQGATFFFSLPAPAV